MGYSITTKDGITINNIPDDIQPDDPRLKQRVAQERSKLSGGTGASPRAAIVPEAAPDPTAGMSKFDKAMANVGAGASDLILGAKQLYTDALGTEDEKRAIKGQVAEKRLLDKALAKSTDMGVMPDWFPTAGDAMQTAGAIAPTMILPFGAVAKGARALPAVARAMRGGPAVAPTVARLGTGALAADAAITGATLGAFSPVAEGESRAMNMASGAALSGVTPMAGAGLDSVRRMVTRSGGQSAAADDLARVLARDGDQQTVLRQTLGRLREQGPAGDIPLSTAARLRDAELARLEAGSRARSGANWYDFDQSQARSVSDAFNRATSSADELAARRGLRSSNWDARWRQAESSANIGKFGDDLGRFRQTIDQAMMSSESSNPAVRNMLNEIAGEIDRLGPNFSLGNLQQIRANLSGGQRSQPQNAYQAAPRDSMATRTVLQEVDDILNRATNGRWQDVVQGYARESQGVNAAKGAGRAREVFYEPSGAIKGKTADALGEVPIITTTGLQRALNKATGPNKQTTLSPEAYGQLQNIIGALRQQDIVQGVKRSATAGGGSNTASDTLAARAAGDAADVLLGSTTGAAAPIARGVIQSLRNAATSQKDRALSEALQNPQQMIALLERKLAAGAPLEPGERWLLNTLRNAPAGALATSD